MKANGRVPVRKMYKLYINGAFARSESGRSDQIDGENVAHASRKDVRDAVVAARAAQEKWAGQTPALRGLVLYRLAEMMEARQAELAAQLVTGGTVDASEAEREVAAAVDRTVWYAGWCDKYLSLASTRNPVGGPHFNFSTPEPTGVVALLAPDEPALLGLVTAVLPVLVSGNAVVVVAGERDPRAAVVFAECLATSDLPGGACNVLTGTRAELGPVLAGHMDVNALGAFGLDAATEKRLAELGAENVKRTRFEECPRRKAWFDERYDDLERVLAYTELKTIWHPARI
ncbi:MAG: aldehyde dehydrogenase family protein [Candidatus Eremiobacteraeota bacterium]|nr:aldehyde dehydrogenase family protein [Candidatus Eremiobacteraeota bacterium]MBV8367313.1 aldehyde dehydrogenase family protein [Candidatus Eremiobacteraeota bacterium]